MAAIRTLKLNLLADTKNFSTGLDHANKQTQSFSSKIGNSLKTVAKSAALAGVAVAGAAVAFGVDAVKAAIEDEKSQTRLAKALKNTTNATKAQVKQVEDLITKMQFQYGVADSELRPAYQRIIASTKDFTKTQQLLQLALDVSAGTGRSVETVAMALSRAYDGNTTALKKLGVPLDANKLKTEGFDYAVQKLGKTFGGQAQANADTFAGKMKILSERWNEFKEGAGEKLIGPLMKVMNYVQNTVIPTMQQMGDGFSGKKSSVSNKVKALADGLGEPIANTPGYNLGMAIRDLAESFKTLLDAFSAPTDGADKQTSTLQTFANAITSVAKAIDTLAAAYRKLAPIIKEIPDQFLDPFGDVKIEWQSPSKWWGNITGRKALGGPVMGRTPYLVGEHGPELFVPSGSGNIVPNGRVGGGTTIINLNGIIDSESARRSIERVLQQSGLRSGAVNFNAGAL